MSLFISGGWRYMHMATSGRTWHQFLHMASANMKAASLPFHSQTGKCHINKPRTNKDTRNS